MKLIIVVLSLVIKHGYLTAYNLMTFHLSSNVVDRSFLKCSDILETLPHIVALSAIKPKQAV